MADICRVTIFEISEAVPFVKLDLARDNQGNRAWVEVRDGMPKCRFFRSTYGGWETDGTRTYFGFYGQGGQAMTERYGFLVSDIPFPFGADATGRGWFIDANQKFQWKVVALNTGDQSIQVHQTFVAAAWKRAWAPALLGQKVRARLGMDVNELLAQILPGIVSSLEIVVTFAGAGYVIGFVGGSLATKTLNYSAGMLGVRVGLWLGEAVLTVMGLGFMLEFMRPRLGLAGDLLKQGLDMAWTCRGSDAELNAAADKLAEGLATFFVLFLEALATWISAKGGLERFKSNVFFGRMTTWLGKNFAALRAKFIPLSWQVLDEGKLFPGTSIPQWMKIRVGNRVFDIWRDPDKPAYLPPHDPVGPAMKHPGEMASNTATKSKPYAASTQTDFPMSVLASALDQAEAQLLFKPRAPNARPVNIDYWEMVVDTTGEIWRVQHLKYTPNPKW